VLKRIEQKCFSRLRRSSPRSLRRSLRSPAQQVWIAEWRDKGAWLPVGTMLLRIYPRTVRIFSLAVLSSHRGHGIGRAMMMRACREARRQKKRRLSLEVDARDTGLIRWYESFGFKRTTHLPDYYYPGRHAWRMQKSESRP
jgi:ribosomal protein S18 acetylase RimI-like enzyme